MTFGTVTSNSVAQEGFFLNWDNIILANFPNQGVKLRTSLQFDQVQSNGLSESDEILSICRFKYCKQPGIGPLDRLVLVVRSVVELVQKYLTRPLESTPKPIFFFRFLSLKMINYGSNLQ